MRLDALRGFAVFVMIVDHVGGDDSWLYRITSHNRFFISAAEPFVFVSGLVMGIVYASLIARSGLRPAIFKAARRVALLYSLNIVLSLTLALLSLQLELPWAPHWGKEGLLGFAAGILTLHRTYYLTDVLLLYTLLVAVAIPLLPLLARRKAWITVPLLGASWALWLAWQLWPDRVTLPWRVSDNEVFNFAAWQVVFVTGLVIGFHRRSLEAWLKMTRPSRLYAILGLSGALFGAIVGIWLWSQKSIGGAASVSFAQLFEKANMSIGRLIVFAVFLVFVFMLLTLAWRPFSRTLGWLFLPLGQSALNAYALHIFFVAVAASAVPGLLGGASNQTASNTAVQAAGIGIIWGILLLSKPAKARLSLFRGRIASQLALALRLPATGSARAAWQVSLAFGLTFAVCLAVLVPVVLSTPGLSGPLRQTLHALNEKGKSTQVFVPTVVAVLPAAVPAAKAASPAPVLSVTPQASPIDLSNALGMKIAPTITPASQSGIMMPTATAPAATATPLPVGARSLTFSSKALGRTMSYIVYLPPGYSSQPSVRYPVLYMLHGIGGTNLEWVGYGLLGWADELMRAGMIKPFIIVLPQGEESYWVDQANAGPQWGAYVARDLVTEVDTHFRTAPERDNRAIGGISMGGHAALQLSINYPNVFGIAGAHSPSLHSYQTAPSFFGDEDWFDAHDPSHLFQSNPEVARTVKLWIDDGQQDAWLPIITAFHQQLVSEDIPHEWHVFSGDTLTGGHTGEYWSTHIPDYLRFYSSAFAQ